MDKNKMLIDATHPEETRVVALRNGRVEEFDFESAARKLLRGNIYLAKVTRVEPSLQAAFIDYGGNRHGFLAFNEIHPDYYQIPVADREALKQEEAAAERWAEAEADERARSRGPRRRRRPRNERGPGNGDGNGNGDGGSGRHEVPDDAAGEVDTFEDGYQTSGAPAAEHEPEHEHGHPSASAGLRHSTSPDDVRHAEPEPSHATEPVDGERTSQPYETPHQAEPQALHTPHDARHLDDHHHRADHRHEAPAAEPQVHGATAWSGYGDESAAPTAAAAAEAPVRAPRPGHIDEADEPADGNGVIDDETVEQVSSEEDALEELPERPRRRARQYKIQEVIKRRQIMLVQVVKEERGNKGAALTTYISLAGRYTVLMPNTARGGGISRKITQPQDRKRLKAIAEELDVEEGMGLIIRTAGAARTKQEIKRDYDYLMRLWESVRELTLSSTAPCVVYEEGNIIKRAIRDLYSKDFDQIVVAGEAAHREAQDFMEMLMPGAGNQVASYRAPEPLFARYGIERQLNALFSPYVTLRSGGYIVINQTEALVSVDVNSGKSTREFSIEETALNTNLEAAEEIARQLKLRDLAGLIVVDFIDMEEKRNNRNVERRLKDSLRHDRARIQVGRISHFGLLEMSRQRLRAGVLEGSTSQCPHCQGTGIIRSIESVALAVLRGLEDHLLKQPTSLTAQTTAEVALYILNHKRAFITEMERRYGVLVRVEASDRMQGANFAVERFAAPAALAKPAARAAVSMEWGFDRDEDTAEEVDEVAAEPVRDTGPQAEDDHRPRAEGGSEDERRGRRRRRRRGRAREGEPREGHQQIAGGAADSGETGDLPDEPMPATEMSVHDAGYDAPEEIEGETDDASEAAVAGEADGERGQGEGGERRRGRRRGRRGGRARRREGSEGLPLATGEGGDDADRHEWGIAEVARPGAEQPSALAPVEAERPLGLVGSVDADSAQRDSFRQPRARLSIVEPAGEASPSHGANPFAASSEEALRLAVLLAGGVPDVKKPESPQTAALSEAKPVAATAPDAAVAPVESFASIMPVAPEPVAAPVAWPAEVRTYGESAGEPATPTSLGNGHAGHAADREPDHAEQARQAPEQVADLAAQSPQDEPSRPSRRGWWQRRFGGAE